MHVVTLSLSARSHLDGQLAYSQRTGCAFASVFPLVAQDKAVSDVAMLMVFPYAAEASVLVNLFGAQTSTTLPRHEISAERLEELLIEQANIAEDRASYPTSLQARCDLSYSLDLAIQLQEGVFLLPVVELPELYLVLEKSLHTFDRVKFSFVVDDVTDTMPALLPESKETACKLLLAVALDIIGRKRSTFS